MNNHRVSMNVRKAAEYLGCSRSYVYQLYENGGLEGLRIGNRQGLRIYLDSCNKFIQSREGM